MGVMDGANSRHVVGTPFERHEGPAKNGSTLAESEHHRKWTHWQRGCGGCGGHANKLCLGTLASSSCGVEELMRLPLALAFVSP